MYNGLLTSSGSKNIDTQGNLPLVCKDLYSQHWTDLLQTITSFFMRECQVQVNISPSTLKEKKKKTDKAHHHWNHLSTCCIHILNTENVCICVCVCLLYQRVSLFIWLRLREVWLAPGFHQSVTWAALHWTALCTQTLTPTCKNISQITHLYQCNTLKIHKIDSNDGVPKDVRCIVSIKF